MNIPNRLIFYRQQHQLLQADVARALGLASTDRISRWEQGQAFPHILNLFKLAHLYQVMPQELYPELYVEIGRALDATTDSAPHEVRHDHSKGPKNGSDMAFSVIR